MEFLFILIIAVFGLPAGIVYLLIEMLLNYSKNKATQEKIKKIMPTFQEAWKDKSGPSFPDLQRTVGGKMSGSSEKGSSGSSSKTAAGQTGTSSKSSPSYTYSYNGSEVKGSTVNRTEPYARHVKRPRKSFLTTAAAIGLFGISGITLLSVLTDVFGGISQGMLDPVSYADNIPALLVSIFCLILGIWLIYTKKRKYDRENRYIAIINQGYGMIPIDNICYLFPEKYDTCVQDLQEMINKGELPGAYIDYSRRLLVLDPNNSSIEPVIDHSHGAAHNASSADGREAAGKTRSKGKKKISEQKIDFLSVERLSKQVKDEDIKMKLIRISTTLKTIGQKADEDPEIRKAAGVDTFMDMYLPKTIRLVEDYEEVNSISDMPQNNELKQSILETLDAIDDAAMTLWKDIIHSDVIDISSELDALQTKLILDGYKKSELEPEVTASEFTFDNMDISEEHPAPAAEHARTASADDKARQAVIKAEIKAEEEEAKRSARRAEEEAKRKAEAEKAAAEAEKDAEDSARRAEDKDAAMEADLFAKLRAEQEKEKELIK
ncbi:MAG: hypothetical protein IKF07_08780 [Eubacterium sp.]|nr:hypothetical protein [Eubacterium sp.]